jgi:hypothetical protein
MLQTLSKGQGHCRVALQQIWLLCVPGKSCSEPKVPRRERRTALLQSQIVVLCLVKHTSTYTALWYSSPAWLPRTEVTWTPGGQLVCHNGFGWLLKVLWLSRVSTTRVGALFACMRICTIKEQPTCPCW